MNDKARFSLTHYPLPKNAQGKTFYDKGSSYGRLRRALQQTIDDHTVGVLSGDPGVGKTTAIRNLIADLPKPDYQVLYLCNTSGSPLDLYRAIGGEIGVRPSHRRGQLWTDIKKTIVHMVDERSVLPVIVLDEAHMLSDSAYSRTGRARPPPSVVRTMGSTSVPILHHAPPTCRAALRTPPS
jgi:Cdc6-like AAA superfamily ATPase